MNNFKVLKTAAILVALSSFALSNEVSAFGAGNLDEENPYGLTNSEKILLKNKKKVDNLDANFGNVKAEVGTIQEQVEGVRSVLEGTNARISQMNTNFSEFDRRINSNEENLTLLRNDYEELKSQFNQNLATQDKNFKEIKKILNELSSLIDSINSNYVSKSKLEEYSKSKQAPKEEIKSENFNEIQSKELMQIALKDFQDKNYEASKQKFQTLVKRNHKPARSSYYLGEIAYNQKLWQEAIENYQKSISLYDKAEYIPRLLYHTAISFDKLGQTQEANQFYKVLKTDYPQTKEAKASPDRK